MSAQGAAGDATGMGGSGVNRQVAGLDPRFARSVRRWLWAYPRRWRLARADEVVGTLAEMAPPGATRLGWRDGLGLVLNGWATTRRMRPPLRVRLAFDLQVGGPIRPQYRGWAADKIASPVYGASLVVILMVAAAFGFSALRNGGGLWFGAYVAVYLVLQALPPHVRYRRRLAMQHLVHRPGDEPTPWDQQPGWVFRDRLAARDVLPHVLASLGFVTLVTGAVGLVAVGFAMPLRVCLLVGAAVSMRLAVRWHRQVPRRPEQPARRPVPISRRMIAVYWAVAVMLLTFLLLPDMGTFTAAVWFGACLMVLPAVALATWLARRGPADITMVDVARLVGEAGPLRVDELERGVVPMWFGPEVAVGLGEIPPAPTDPTPA